MQPGGADEDPYLKLYDIELFISYAHGPVDDKGWGPLRTWSKHFQRHLRQNLRMYAEDPIRFWFDQNYKEEGIDQLAPLDEQLETQIERSALFQIHMSDKYLKSAWCARERHYWYAASDKRGDRKDRVSVIRVTDTDEEQWPAELRPNGFSLPGEVCHDTGKKEPWGFGHLWKDAAPTPELGDALVNVARSLADKLYEIRNNIRRQHMEREQVLSLRGKGKPPLLRLHAPTMDTAARHEMTEALAARHIEVEFGMPSTADLAKLGQTVSDCSAMLIVATDAGQLKADLSDIGSWPRSATAHFQKTIPCAVLDFAGMKSSESKLSAETRGIHWLNKQKRWDFAVAKWLSGPAADMLAQRYGVDEDDDA